MNAESDKDDLLNRFFIAEMSLYVIPRRVPFCYEKSVEEVILVGLGIDIQSRRADLVRPRS